MTIAVLATAACDGSGLASHGDAAATMPDVPIGEPRLCADTAEPLQFPAVVTSETPRSRCVPADGSFPAECVRPTGVTWVEPHYEGAFATVPLPAGAYFEDPVAGCLWFVVWPEWGGRFRIETAALGCTVSLVVPDILVETGCGRTSYSGRGCTTIGMFHETCDSSARGMAASGGAFAHVDGIAGTLTTTGWASTTGSSPHSCACE
jgi:hypothetical protein